MRPRWLAATSLVLICTLIFVAAGVAFAQEGTEEPAPEVTVDAPVEATVEATPESTVEATPEATDAPADCSTYTVQSGDTLARIAQRFNTTAQQIAADNGITNPNLIFGGQQLRICGPGAATPTATPGPTNTPAPTVTPVPGETGVYVVQRGDTLARIAQQFNTTIQQIMALNGLTNENLIFVGQELIVPNGPQPTETVPVDATAVPASFDPNFDYGIEAYIAPDDAATTASQITSLGMHWVKLDVNWRDIEAIEGVRDYTALDTVVGALTEQNLSILFTVSASPDWARTSVDEVGPPDDFADFAAFVGDLAAHFAGRVQGYEIWSEPNLRREWNSIDSISPESYLQLLQGAYAAIKAADPDAMVISAGMAPTGFNDGVNAINDRIYLQGLYQGGLADVSDAVAAHPGGWANPPDAICCDAPVGVETHFEDPSFYFLGTLTDYRNIMVGADDGGTPIWITKFGWGTSEDTEAPSSIYVFVTYTSLAEQAIFAPRAFEIAANLGYVGPMFLHNLNGCQYAPSNAELCYYSLIGPNGSPRPVRSAIEALDTEAEPGAETTLEPVDVATEEAPADTVDEPAATAEAGDPSATATNVG